MQKTQVKSMNQSNIVNQSVKQLNKQQIKQPTDQRKKSINHCVSYIWNLTVNEIFVQLINKLLQLISFHVPPLVYINSLSLCRSQGSSRPHSTAHGGFERFRALCGVHTASSSRKSQLTGQTPGNKSSFRLLGSFGIAMTQRFMHLSLDSLSKCLSSFL